MGASQSRLRNANKESGAGIQDSATIRKDEMKAIYRNRLLKLARHLESGKLGHDKFEFSTIHRVNCKTAGCAIGECPYVFRHAWTFRDTTPRLFRSRANGILRNASFQDAESWFGLEREESTHLFNPNCQQPTLYGGRMLGDGAKKESVAANIRAFIKRKERAKL